MKKIRFTMVLTALLLCGHAQAQDVKETARKHFNAEEYSKALPLYRELLAKFPGEPEYQFSIGVCLVNLNTDLDEAVNLLRPAPVTAYSTLALYYIGRALHLSYSFEEAIKAYSKFMMKATKTDIKKYEPARLIEMARNGIEYTRSGQNIIVQNVQSIQQDQLQLITGLNSSGKIIRKPVEFCTKTDMRNGYRPWMFLPSYTEVNDYIFVSGYDKGKKGSKQIFRLRNINHTTWGFPELLSDVVNTPHNEEFPYFDIKTSTLYFSSNGHSSMGGYDIFKTVYDWNTKTWSKPENLGFPINSPFDDYAYLVDDFTHTESFVSNRNCKGDQIELYRVKLTGDRLGYTNIDEIRKAAELEALPVEKPVVTDTTPAIRPAERVQEKSDYNKILAQALQLQIKADSFARITRDLRIIAKETPDDSIKKQLVTDVLRNDKMAKSIQREADAKFSDARKAKGEPVVSSDSLLKPAEQINNIQIYQYKPEAVTRKDDFAMLGESLYSDTKPIPMGMSMDTGLVYRVQLGAFSKVRPNNSFGGISPVWYEQIPGSTVFKYYAGKFYSVNAVTKALNIIRSNGFPDAFIVAFYEGKPISTEKAREIEFAGFRL
jgi:hypothetical protein